MVPILAPLALFLLTGCFQSVDRIDFANLGVQQPTSEAPPPTNTPVASPTPTPTEAPTPEPTEVPTPTPEPPRGLFLEILNPDEGTTVNRRNVTVTGKTNAGNTIEVNGNGVNVDRDGKFTAETTLSMGVNVIEVLATTPFGEQRRGFISVVYIRPTPPPFFLLVTEPANQIIVVEQNIQVSGSTIPRASVSVNGVGVFVDEEGKFSTMISLNPGSNTITTLARNTDGRTLRDSRTVDYAGGS